MDTDATDRQAIRGLIDDFVIARDAGHWEQLEGLFHPDGQMVTMFFRGSGKEFVQASRAAFAAGLLSHHVNGGTSIEIAAQRAVAQTKTVILVRGQVDGVLCDITAHVHFYDLLERRAGRWGLVLRHPISEGDRIDAVDPSTQPALDAERLAALPPNYSHMAYAMSAHGRAIEPGMPSLRGAEVEGLYRLGREFLTGAPLDLASNDRLAPSAL
jgi:hypothetical protein